MEISGGNEHVCALVADLSSVDSNYSITVHNTANQVFCWGENNLRVLGSSGAIQPYQQTDFLSEANPIQTCAFPLMRLFDNGSVMCWGDNEGGDWEWRKWAKCFK